VNRRLKRRRHKPLMELLQFGFKALVDKKQSFDGSAQIIVAGCDHIIDLVFGRLSEANPVPKSSKAIRIPPALND
jgi:hypothetical protein